MVVKPNDDENKGHQKLMGEGKRQKPKRRHKSDLQTEDRKMVNFVALAKYTAL